MKKAIVAMLVMFILIAFLGGIWQIVLKPIIGGRIDQTYLYPIYGGLIVLAGLVVGAASVICDEIKMLREEIKAVKDGTKQE